MPRRGPPRKHIESADGFTDRERDLLTLLSKGFTVVSAAERMGLSPHTLRGHVKVLFKKMDASTQAEAVYRALKEGIIR